MKFNAKVRKLIDNGKPLKATCSVTMDDQSESYTDADGNEQFRDVCHPITSALRKEMEDAVFAAYNDKILEESLKALNID